MGRLAPAGEKERMTPRPVLSPYLRGNAWWARVPVIDGVGVRRPLGIYGKDSRGVAAEACQFLVWLRNRRNAFLLDAIHSGRTSAGKAFSAYAANRLDAFTDELRQAAGDADLEPYVAKWQRELERRKRPSPATRATYLRQLRTLIPAGQPFRRSQFTRQRVRDWLESLEIGQTNRYRAAASSFAQYLVFEDAIPANPVRLVGMARENEPRTLHLTQAEAKKLVESFTVPRMRAFHALMLATGMEFSAAKRVDPATVTDDTVFADGTKGGGYRKRTATVYPRWKWAWNVARAHILQYRDGEHPFAAINRWSSRDALATAVKRAGVNTDYTTHDHRHTWGVQMARDGYPLQLIANQLGHRDATMAAKVYTRFLSDRHPKQHNERHNEAPAAEASDAK